MWWGLWAAQDCRVSLALQVLLVLKVPPALLDFRVVPEPSALLAQRVLLVLSGPGGLLALLVSLA